MINLKLKIPLAIWLEKTCKKKYARVRANNGGIRKRNLFRTQISRSANNNKQKERKKIKTSQVQRFWTDYTCIAWDRQYYFTFVVLRLISGLIIFHSFMWCLNYYRNSFVCLLFSVFFQFKWFTCRRSCWSFFDRVWNGTRHRTQRTAIKSKRAVVSCRTSQVGRRASKEAPVAEIGGNIELWYWINSWKDKYIDSSC